MKHANVALFIPHNGCSHQCSFCSQRSITGQQTQPEPKDVERAVQTALQSGCDPQHAEIAFFGGSFTAIEPAYMCSLLEAAAPFVGAGGFAGIRVSTRPDAVEETVLALLKSYGVTSIELGAQSMDDRVLFMNGRGHTAAQVEDASRRVREFGFSLGLQMMTGLYGDTPAESVETSHRLAALKPDTVRIYPTVIMKGTELGERYLCGEYEPMELETAVSLCADLLDFFEEKEIRVIRLGLHSTPELLKGMLAGPWHPAFRELCESRRIRQKLLKDLHQLSVSNGSAVVHVNPHSISKALGQKKENLLFFAAHGWKITFVQDASVVNGEIQIQKEQL